MRRRIPSGIVTCVGGQTANNLTPLLSRYGIQIIGTSSENVDKAEIDPNLVGFSTSSRLSNRHGRSLLTYQRQRGLQWK